jgi:hypothetical protein
LKHGAKVGQKIGYSPPGKEKNCLGIGVYKYMTITIWDGSKSAENQAGYGKKNLTNVGIMSPSCLIFARN